MDCGLFHTFDVGERLDYVASLGSVTEPGATLHVLCFSDQDLESGPHPVSRDELAAAFDRSRGWSVEVVAADRLLTRYHEGDGAPAWLATIRRS